MSAIPLGNFTSRANQQAQLQKYKNYLQLQMKLQRDFEQANKVAYREGGLPARPAEIGEFKSAEEATQSVFEQRKVLRENLRKVFKYEKDLLKALDLIPIEEAGSFNQSFGLFYPKIQGISNLTPDQMMELWTRFKRSTIRGADNLPLVGIDDTGRRIELEQLANALMIQAKRLPMSARDKRQIVVDIESALEADDEATLRSISKRIRSGTKIALEEEVKQTEELSSYNQLIRVVKEEILPSWNDFSAVYKLGKYNKIRGDYKAYVDLIKEFILKENDITNRDKIEQAQMLARSITAKQGITIYNKFNELLFPSVPIVRTGVVEEAEGKEGEVVGSGSKKKRGRKPANHIVGKGIDVEPTVKWLTFGKYLVDKPALYNPNSPKLVVKYPSKAGIAEFPNSMITAELARILKTIIEEQRVNFKMVQDLSPKEQTLLYNLAEKARINEKIGLHGVKSEQLEKEAKEFELLRGQVLAGNNSPQLLKQLKTMVMKFMADGRMPKSEGNQILFEIQMLI